MRRRHWGWGDEDDAVGEGAAEIAAHLGFGSADLEEPAPLAVDHDRALHGHGASYLDVVRALRGDLPHLPDVVAHPGDEGEVLRALEQRGRRQPVGHAVRRRHERGRRRRPGARPGPRRRHVARPRAARPRAGGRPVSRAARIQAGATGPRIEEQLAEHGMTLRFYPQSFERSTLGGWIATRAAGHFATGPTHIDDLVESIRAITPRGDVWESRRLPASGAGPSPDRLLLGSEGTLAVITEAWVRIRPRDVPRWSARVELDDFATGLELIREIVQGGMRPSNCRLIDAREAALTFAGDSALLLLGFEGDLSPVDARSRPRRPPRQRVSEGGSGGWRDAFLRAPYLRDTLVVMGVFTETFETAVTWDRLAGADRRR